jgi:hypothetical protein
MKSKAGARWARRFALGDVPTARKEVAAKLALECWGELTKGLITSVCDFDDTYTEDADEESDTTDDDPFIGIDAGNSNLAAIDLMTIIDKSTETREEWT